MTATRQAVSATQEALARATVYQALAHAFHHPAPQRRRRAEPLPGVRAALQVLRLSGEVAEALAGAEGRLSALTPRALAAEHVALFSHGREGQGLPYEADFTAVSVFQKSQEMADVAGFYRAFGLAWENGQERPDHLSLEAEFMYFLALKEAYALSQDRPDDAAICRDAQRSFLRDHPGRWLPAFRRALESEAPASPYATLARFAEAYVRADCRLLRARPRPVRARTTVAAEPDLDCNGCPMASDGENDA